MILGYSPRALDDIESINAYLIERNPGGAVSVLTAIRRSVDLILLQPFAAPRANRPDLRVKLVAGYPYKIFYRAKSESIEIVHVRHAARRPLD